MTKNDEWMDVKINSFNIGKRTDEYIIFFVYIYLWQKRSLEITPRRVSMDVLIEEWFYVSLGLCGVCSLHVVSN